MPLRIAFIHPDLGIGGAERLVVDAAIGLQNLGHSVDIYTSYHNPAHCFDETKDGTLRVHPITPPFPRSIKGKFHILFAHLRQLHLTTYLLRSSAPRYDVYFVDQLPTCIPFLRAFAKIRVLFYCHFPDKLLASGEFAEANAKKRKVGLLKSIYRFPMDLLEDLTMRQADVIVANSQFTARVLKSVTSSSLTADPGVIYPGINLAAYKSTSGDTSDPNVVQVSSNRPTLLSLNRCEKKKNTILAISAFALLRNRLMARQYLSNIRLVVAGGYDARLVDNISTLESLVSKAESCSLTYDILTPTTSEPISIPFKYTRTDNPDVTFLLNFTSAQRSALLHSSLALLYTPNNEHFGIGPVEAMVCGLPVLACNTGGPTETIVDNEDSPEERTGWLRPPDPQVWADALMEIVDLSPEARQRLVERGRARVEKFYSMDAMAKSFEDALVNMAEMGPVHISWYLSWTFLILSVLLLYLSTLVRYVP